MSFCLLARIIYESQMLLPMRISLIGMSGSGKSHWSIKLAQNGFHRFCCDDLIAERLAQELIRDDGEVMDVGEWMGFPYEVQYKELESKYLAYEIEVLGQILKYLSRTNPQENIVVDTTGSVIYTGKKILRKLQSNTTVVHLATPPEIKQQMLKSYVTSPRPVLWRDVFYKEPGETNNEALVRCYPRLLFSRERLYEKYAEVTIDYYTRNREGYGVNDFLVEVQAVADKP